MNITDRKELVLKTTTWLENTDLEVKKSGGSGFSCITLNISGELLYTLIANDLYIFYAGQSEKL